MIVAAGAAVNADRSVVRHMDMRTGVLDGRQNSVSRWCIDLIIVVLQVFMGVFVPVQSHFDYFFLVSDID